MDKILQTILTIPKIIDEEIQSILENNENIVYCTPILSGEFYGPNSNLDYFPESELIGDHHTYGYITFLGKPFITYHGKGGAEILGNMVFSRYNNKIKAVEVLIELTDPETFNFIKRYGMLPVSMGCRVDYDECSYCGNKAKNKLQYCDHVRAALRNIYNRLTSDIYLINHKPVFYEVSKVSIPADPRAYAYYYSKIMDLMSFKSSGFNSKISNDTLDTQSSIVYQNHKFQILTHIMNMMDKNIPEAEIKKYLTDEVGLSSNLVDNIIKYIKELLNLVS